MTLMDTTDGLFMNLAYGWAFFNPVRKVYYNLAITGLSVIICFFIGAIETLSLLPQEIKGLGYTIGFWGSCPASTSTRPASSSSPCSSSPGLGCPAHLALRPHRGKMGRPPPGRASRRNGALAAVGGACRVSGRMTWGMSGKRVR